MHQVQRTAWLHRRHLPRAGMGFLPLLTGGGGALPCHPNPATRPTQPYLRLTLFPLALPVLGRGGHSSPPYVQPTYSTSARVCQLILNHGVPARSLARSQLAAVPAPPAPMTPSALNSQLRDEVIGRRDVQLVIANVAD